MGETEINLSAIPDTIAENDPRLELRFEGMIGISTRCCYALINNSVQTVRDLFSRMNEDLIRNGDITWLHTEKSLLRIPNFGRKCLAELKEVLALHGLRIGMRIVAADAAALTPETVNGLTPEIRGQVALLMEAVKYLPADNLGLSAIQEELGVVPETLEALILRGLSDKPSAEHAELMKKLLGRFMVMAPAR